MKETEKNYPSLDSADEHIEPPLPHLPYRSTQFRTPQQAFVQLPDGPATLTGPSIPWPGVDSRSEDDLTTKHNGTPLGQRIILSGRVVDQRKQPISGALIEIWQANAAGRYAHKNDQWDAPLDDNFTGSGYAVSDAQGHYRFVTIQPGAYPWGNHDNAWRPAHIHFSILGPVIGSRLVTQMYFPGDPLIEIDPIANAIPMPYRQRMVAQFDIATTQPNWALGYRFDLVLRGIDATPLETS